MFQEIFISGFFLILQVYSQNLFDNGLDYRCPEHWVQFQQSCYRFIKSPLRRREDARKNCAVS